jgi:signal peptidase I
MFHLLEAGMTERPGHRPVNRAWREYRGTLLFLLLMLTFRSAWADWMTVPTGSMNPTIIEGDRIMVDKHVYGLRVPFTLMRLTEGREPQRGEIVVFDSPVDGISLVKRLVGLPGDVLSLDERGLVINGQYSSYSRGDAGRLHGLPADTLAYHPRVWRESGVLPDHDILRMPLPGARAFFGPIVVPEGMYFMLGDSRDNSADSRYFGFVPRRNLVGRAASVAISFNRENYYLPRACRFLVPLD